MPAQINIAIPERNFERIGKRIGEILATELNNQHQLQQTPNPAIFWERTTTINSDECPVLNVCFAGMPLSAHHATYLEGQASYNIDIYVSRSNQGEERGDALSGAELQRLLGICLYILQHPVYKTLGYEPGFIDYIQLSTVTVDNPGNTMDAGAGLMGRLVVTTRLCETTAYQEPKNATGYLTTVNLGETEQGYQYLVTGNGGDDSAASDAS